MRGQRSRSFLPSFSLPSLIIHLLTLPVGGSYLAKLGLRKTTEARREQRLRSSVLRKNLCTSPTTEVQAPCLQSRRQVRVQRVLWACTRQVTSLFFSTIFPHPHSTGHPETPFNVVMRIHVSNAGNNPKLWETCAWGAIAPSQGRMKHD